MRTVDLVIAVVWVGAGLALFLLGLALAVWARLYIGRNWGTPMSHKDKPELVTTGPPSSPGSSSAAPSAKRRTSPSSPRTPTAPASTPPRC